MEASFSFTQENPIPKENFLFESGLTVLEMQSARDQSIETLRGWLVDIRSAWVKKPSLHVSDLTLVSHAFHHIEMALRLDHKKKVPFLIAIKAPMERIEWLLENV